MKIKTLILLCALLTSGQGFAHDENGDYELVSLGARSCGEYTAAIGDGDNAKYIYFTSAFLGATNFYLPDTWNISGATDPKGFMDFLAKYCAGNPLDSYHSALLALVTELYPNRTISAPK
jgi:hypothetical protein